MWSTCTAADGGKCIYSCRLRKQKGLSILQSWTRKVLRSSSPFLCSHTQQIFYVRTQKGHIWQYNSWTYITHTGCVCHWCADAVNTTQLLGYGVGVQHIHCSISFNKYIWCVPMLQCSICSNVSSTLATRQEWKSSGLQQVVILLWMHGLGTHFYHCPAWCPCPFNIQCDLYIFFCVGQSKKKQLLCYLLTGRVDYLRSDRATHEFSGRQLNQNTQQQHGQWTR